jgi:serine/threonine protein kinase
VVACAAGVVGAVIVLCCRWSAVADLSGILANRRIKMSWRRRMLVALDILQAIANLHEQELIHRDIKTENVLVRDALPACARRVASASMVCRDRSTTTGAASCATTASRGRRPPASRPT